MKKTIIYIVKWIGRILLGLVALIILAFIVFNLFRGKIVDKGINYVNDMYPGNVQLEKIKLRPFRHFPDLSLQLNELSFYQGIDSAEMNDTLPLFKMDEIYVALDVVQLLKGKYKVSKLRIGEGEINYIVFADSVSNVEMALGMSFGNVSEEEEIKGDSSSISLDMNDLDISNLILSYVDETADINISAHVNHLKSAFTYLPEMITAALDLNVDLNRAEYEDIVLDKPRSLLLTSTLIYDLILEKVSLDHSTLDIKDAVFELSGDVLLAQNNFMNIFLN